MIVFGAETTEGKDITFTGCGLCLPGITDEFRAHANPSQDEEPAAAVGGRKWVRFGRTSDLRRESVGPRTAAEDYAPRQGLALT